MTKTKRSLLTTRQLSTVAILAAIAAVLFMIEIPVVLFYKLDLSSLPVLLGAFSMGPLPGTMILLVKALLGLLHTTSQGVGELADFIMGFAMMFPAAVIYRRMKSRKGAIVGMGQALLPAVNTVGKFVLLITAPFNILKWVVISVVTALIYKPLSPILHGRKKSGTEAKKI